MYEEDFGESVFDVVDYALEDYDFDYDEEYEEGYDFDVDDVLDALMEEADGDDELAERRRRSRRRRRRGQRRVPTARGRSAYRPPVKGQYVTQKQFSESLRRVGADIRRNAMGIKTVNTRIGRLDKRVSGVVSVNAAQSRKISKLDKTIKLDGALEFAESYNGSQLDLFALFKGAVKSGLLDNTKGVLANPVAVGGLGLLLNILRNNPQVLGSIVAPAGGTQ